MGRGKTAKQTVCTKFKKSWKRGNTFAFTCRSKIAHWSHYINFIETAEQRFKHRQLDLLESSPVGISVIGSLRREPNWHPCQFSRVHWILQRKSTPWSICVPKIVISILKAFGQKDEHDRQSPIFPCNKFTTLLFWMFCPHVYLWQKYQLEKCYLHFQFESWNLFRFKICFSGVYFFPWRLLSWSSF